MMSSQAQPHPRQVTWGTWRSVTWVSTRAAEVGVRYSGSLSATGGRDPYTWTASGLPAGLSLAVVLISYFLDILGQHVEPVDLCRKRRSDRRC